MRLDGNQSKPPKAVGDSQRIYNMEKIIAERNLNGMIEQLVKENMKSVNFAGCSYEFVRDCVISDMEDLGYFEEE